MKTPRQVGRGPDALWGVGDALAALIAWTAGGSAAFVALLGQFALAAVLALIALGIALRLWRTRRRRRSSPPG